MTAGSDPLVFAFWPGGSAGDPARPDLLGGKGASLAALCRAGFPVPPGFTISAICCEFVEEHGTWPPGLDAQIQVALAELESRIDRRLGVGPRALLVAVRSGAAVSMPGMMDTILNCGLHSGLIDTFASPNAFWSSYAEHLRMFLASVTGTAAPANDEQEPPRVVADRLLDEWERRTGSPLPDAPWERLRLAIDAVFASWNSQRARTYRRHHDIRDVRGTAVNVQAMFPSDRAGVLFTANPQSPRAAEIVLEASWGLGEAVVSGAVTPDVYVLDAETLRIKQTAPGQRPHDEPALSESQILTLGELGRKVERHFGYPCDVEWGWADEQPALLQARAIKGLDLAADLPDARRDEVERLKTLSKDEPVVWVLHNLAETLPAPTPLTTDLMRGFLSARGGFGRLYRILGFCPADTSDSVIELLGGRPYVDPRRAARLFFGELPLGYDLDLLRTDRQTIEGPPQRLELERADPFFFLRVPQLLGILWRAARREKQLRIGAVERFEQRVVRPVAERLSEWAATDLGALSDAVLCQEWRRRRDWVLGELAAESLLPGYLGGLAYARLNAALVQYLGAAEGDAWSSRLTSGLAGDVTVAQNERLDEVARGQASLAEFLHEYGQRALGEMELAQPRWCEDAAYVERIVRQWRERPGESPARRHAAQAIVRESSERDLPELLARHGASSQLETVAADLRLAQRLLPYRELGKYHLLRGYATLREVAEEWARRWSLQGDVYFLTEDEIERFGERRDALIRDLPRRKLRWRSLQKLGFPEVIDSRRLAELESSTLTTGAAENQGASWAVRTLSAGVVEGTAQHVIDPNAVGELASDCILICPSTDPGWTPLFVRIRGLVVERGGVLSHGAIVARDFGIPAAACEGALTRIGDGARVRLDANLGRITVLEDAT